MTFLLVPFRVCRFHLSCDTLSVTFHAEVSAESLTARCTDGMTVGRQALNTGARTLLLDGGHFLEAIWRLYVEGDVGWIHQQKLARLIFREDRVQICEDERISPGKLANNVTKIVHLDSTFVNVRKIILKFAIALEKDYSEKIVASCIVDIV